MKMVPHVICGLSLGVRRIGMHIFMRSERFCITKSVNRSSSLCEYHFLFSPVEHKSSTRFNLCLEESTRESCREREEHSLNTMEQFRVASSLLASPPPSLHSLLASASLRHINTGCKSHSTRATQPPSTRPTDRHRDEGDRLHSVHSVTCHGRFGVLHVG